MVGFEQSTVFVRESNKSAELCAVVYEPFEESLPEIFNVMVFTEDGRASKNVIHLYDPLSHIFCGVHFLF